MADLKKKNRISLEKELQENRAALQQFRFGSSGSKTRNVREGQNLRKDIARILTELNSREG